MRPMSFLLAHTCFMRLNYPVIFHTTALCRFQVFERGTSAFGLHFLSCMEKELYCLILDKLRPHCRQRGQLWLECYDVIVSPTHLLHPSA